MSRITKKELTKYFKFLEEYKQYVGFSDWTVRLKVSNDEVGDAFACVNIDIYEKIVTISIADRFAACNDDRKANILFHELVHSRTLYMNEKIKEAKDVEEEHMINDIIRGFEAFGVIEL